VATTVSLTRRDFIRRGSGLGVGGLAEIRWATSSDPGAEQQVSAVLDGSTGPIDLSVGESVIEVEGRRARAVTINGAVPGPLLRFREGDEAIIRVTNELDEDTSIHWHGMLVPNGMDGVPGVTFPGIRPGETFTYRFPVRQYGTYWYHSHSGLQEQSGHYGPIVIDPAAGEPVEFDREHVLVFSDWTFENPGRVLARLKKQPDYYNFQKRTVFDFFHDAAAQGLARTVRDRLEWAAMRMSPADISDVTGATYTYLVNGHGPDRGWTAAFRPGERVRLRFINASAASLLDVRIPGLPMTVMQVSGQHVRPVETDEFRIAIAETYDVIVAPAADRAYTIFAEAIDRSGYARATLAPAPGMEGPVPARRKRPLLTMADMGMSHDMSAMGHDMPGMDMGGQVGVAIMLDEAADSAVATPQSMPGMETMPRMTSAEGVPGLRPPGAVPDEVMHGPDHHGRENASVPMSTKSRLAEPGVGLGEDGWRVLTYADLEASSTNPELRPPDREIELHLTGNMERFQWSIDGLKSSEARPIHVMLGERIRLILVNDTMMNHPMHLHGMFMELENGKGEAIPRVHTINVKPAERMSLLFTADAPGAWAFHCHVLYHMVAGMFRVVRVMDPAEHPAGGTV
jgi:CopA family copper-resistance protein